MAQLAQLVSASSSLKASYVVLFLVIVFFGRLAVKAWWTPLRHVPGPFLAKFTRLWKLLEVRKGSFEKTNIALHRKYGPIVRIAPDEYSIDDLEAVKIIYGHGSQFAKSPWYFASGSPNPHEFDLFTERDIARHAAMRRKVASAYSMTALLQMEKYVDDCTALFARRLREFAKAGSNLNMTQWLQFYAFDVIGELTVAKKFGFIESGQDIGGIVAAIDQYLSYLSNVGVYSEWHPFCTKVITALRGGRSYMIDFTKAQLDEREQMGHSPHELEGGADFLSKFLGQHKQNPEYFTEQDVFVGCITNIGAGSDTTSVSLSAVFYNLCKHPDVLQKLREELEAKRAEGKLSDPVTFKESQDCPYLQAVIKEALRVHPATGFPLGRVVPKGGATIANTYFPEGTIVGVNSWVAHANKLVFGEDAETFRPDRWLTSKEKYNQMDRYYFTFGLGARTCIGKNISIMEISKLVPKLVLDFDFELVNPNAELKTRNVWFVKQESFLCRVHVRQN